jgi:hypothetical protein
MNAFSLIEFDFIVFKYRTVERFLSDSKAKAWIYLFQC